MVENYLRKGSIVYLTKIFRQSDQLFIDCLQAARIGKLEQKHVDLLQSRVKVVLSTTDGVKPTRLYPHRNDVEFENIQELNRLTGSSVLFEAVDKGKEKDLLMLDRSCQVNYCQSILVPISLPSLGRKEDLFKKGCSGCVVTKFGL